MHAERLHPLGEAVSPCPSDSSRSQRNLATSVHCCLALPCMEASSGMHHTAGVSVQPGYWPVEHNCHHKDILGMALRKLQGAQNGSIACRGLWRPQSQTHHPWEKPRRASCRKPAWLETCMSSRLPLRTRSRRGVLLLFPLSPAQTPSTSLLWEHDCAPY